MIIKMKKAQIVVLQEDKDKLLKSLQRYGVLMIIDQKNSANLEETQTDDVTLQRIKKSMILLNRFAGKKPLFGEVNSIDYQDFEKENFEAKNTIHETEDIEEDINYSKNEISTIKEEIKVLDPWREFELLLAQIDNTKYTNCHLGYCEKSKIDTYIETMEKYGCIYYVLGSSKVGQAVCFYNFIDDETLIIDELKTIGYFETQLPKYNGKVKQLINEKEEQITSIENHINEQKARLEVLSKKVVDIELYNDQLINNKKLKKADYANTISTTYIEGWVRTDQIELLEEAIEKATEVYDLELIDPTKDETPPTYTKNNRVVSQFESITDMFSKPNYREADPNPVMSFWYWILFGMMVGDIGYGIVLFLVTLLFIKLAHPKGGTLKLTKILMYSSIPTIIWGIVFNSFFGASVFGEASIFGAASIFGTNCILAKFTFVPLDSAITMLVVSVIVGALHLITGLFVKAVASIKEGDILEMLSGQLSWILIMLGIGAYAASMFIDAIPYLNYIGLGMIGLGVVFILLFKGRHKKGIINKALSGVLGLYDITGYMSDLLSYTRIMALVMSSAAVAMVMNILAGMVQGSFIGYVFSILIYIIGHTFNLVLGLLSAYVHDSRLQYIEFFGKFYEGGGYDFKPLALQTQYLYEITDQKK